MPLEILKFILQPKMRFALSIVFWGGFLFLLHKDHARPPFISFTFDFFGITLLCYLFLYLTEKSTSDDDETVGKIGSYFFFLASAMSFVAKLLNK